MFFYMRIVTVFLVLFGFIGSKIVQVQVLSRHCDRNIEHGDMSFLNNFKETTDVRKFIHVPFGDLTPLGGRQCFQLGKYLHKKYLDKNSPYRISTLPNPEEFNIDHFYFRSTEFQRTINSMISIGYSLLPNKKGNRIYKPNNCSVSDESNWNNEFPFPNGEQIIPVFSKSLEDDVMESILTCNTVKETLSSFQDSHSGKYIWNTLSETISNLSDLSGNDLSDFRAFSKFYDLTTTLKNHNRLPKVLEDVFVEKIQYCYNIFYDAKYSRFSLGNLAGGPLINQIRDDLSDYIEDQKIYRLDWEAMYIHYSTHDVVITSVLTALGLKSKYETLLSGHVALGSCLIFELHQDDNDPNLFKVVIIYKDGWDGPENILRIQNNKPQKNYSSFSFFSNYVDEVASPKDYCKDCGIDDTKTYECMIRKKKNLEDELKKLKLDNLGYTIGISIIVLLEIILVTCSCLICSAYFEVCCKVCDLRAEIKDLKNAKRIREQPITEENEDDDDDFFDDEVVGEEEDIIISSPIRRNLISHTNKKKKEEEEKKPLIKKKKKKEEEEEVDDDDDFDDDDDESEKSSVQIITDEKTFSSDDLGEGEGEYMEI